jgi:hypothetical protein
MGEGMTVCDIQAHPGEWCGLDVARDPVQPITDAVAGVEPPPETRGEHPVVILTVDCRQK